VTHGGRLVPLRRSALRIPRGRRASGRLGSFALWTGLPSSLVGRYSHDYYGPSVAMGLAPRRRSRVRPCRTSERDVGVPFVSLIALIGQRSTPRRLRRVRFDPVAERGAGIRCLSGGPTVRSSGDWASGKPAFAISRGSIDAPPLTPGLGRRFAGRRLIPFTFQIRVSHWTQEPSFEFLAAMPGIQKGASRRTIGLCRSPTGSPFTRRTTRYRR
jgi:hypothetical protein